MKRFVRLIACALLLVPASCGGSGGGGGGSRPEGFVGELTGDPDDEVSFELEEQVIRAFQRGEADEPIPD